MSPKPELNKPNTTQICSRCILDSNDDSEITFDSNGVCNYCHEYDAVAQKTLLKNTQTQQKELNKIISLIKDKGSKNKYDCLIGVSGGVDSTYLIYMSKKLGLNPLIVHYDNGWDSELAVINIENIVKKLDLDLVTYVNDWQEFKDIQLSFLKASVVDIELITDQAILAVLYDTARKYKIKYILYGTNIATEATLPKSWYHWKIDLLNITSIQDIFGKIPLKTYPKLGFFKHYFITKFLKIENIHLLNYLDYNKKNAKETIIRELNWKDYGGKHYESIFTRFYQAYILPKKFNIDKRKAHLSTLICSKQITREEALIEIQKPIYDQRKLRDDYEYVIKKLGLTENEFEKYMSLPVKPHTFYPSYFNRHYKYQKLLSNFIKTIFFISKKTK